MAIGTVGRPATAASPRPGPFGSIIGLVVTPAQKALIEQEALAAGASSVSAHLRTRLGLDPSASAGRGRRYIRRSGDAGTSAGAGHGAAAATAARDEGGVS